MPVSPHARVRPLRSVRKGTTIFRYFDIPSRLSPAGGVVWSSCSTRSTGFRETPGATYTRGFNLETRGGQNATMGAAIALVPAFALAYHAASGAVFSAFEPFRRLSGPSYINLTKPCSEGKGGNF